MSPKIVLVTIGVLMTLHGIGIYLVAGSMLEYTDPTEAMITMGAKLNETTGIMTLLVGVILLFSNNIETNSAKKVVVGTGISMAICCFFFCRASCKSSLERRRRSTSFYPDNFRTTYYMVFLCWPKKRSQ